jgi:hypothetical protein
MKTWASMGTGTYDVKTLKHYMKYNAFAHQNNSSQFIASHVEHSYLVVIYLLQNVRFVYCLYIIRHDHRTRPLIVSDHNSMYIMGNVHSCIHGLPNAEDGLQFDTT